jgi:DNA invertase Pin-like site-specific DNA recombinase
MSPAHRGRFVSYCRLSTDRQGKSGLGLEAQKKAVADYLNGGSWELVGEFVEIESGKRADRPELAKAIDICKRQKAKLVIAKLDRLSRNLAFIATMMEAGVEFVAVDNPTANRLTIHILAAVAQHEREMIAERTKAALQAAKARGKRLGNPRLADVRGKGSEANRIAADQFAANVLPIIKQIQKQGITSAQGIAVELTARSVRTARGGRWSHVQVAQLLARAG